MNHFVLAVAALLLVLLTVGAAEAAPGSAPGSTPGSPPATTDFPAPIIIPHITPSPAPHWWFNRYWEHWGQIDDSFHAFTAEVKPAAVQIGFFGPEYYAGVNYAITKKAPAAWYSLGGGPADTKWWRDFIAKEHAQGVKVIGQISMAMVFGDPDKNAGWFGYFDRDWDEKVLGPKPTGDNGQPLKAMDLMQYDKPGVLYQAHDYKIEGGGEYFVCQSNPHYREVLKRCVKAGIDMGLDGYAVIFPIHENCVCPYCQAGFRQFLHQRYTPRQLQQRFGITDLDHHTFTKIKGFYDPNEASPLALESLKFVEMQIWECGRQCVIEYGRKLKPDLLVGEWNHNYRSSMSGPGQIAGTFAQLNADERCVLPSELWAKDENWVWYSIGNWSLYWFPEKGEFAQFDLVHKYLHAAGHGVPQAVKRDDGINLRLYVAEAVAHDGFAYARGPRYDQPGTREAVKPYFDFLRTHEDLYRDVRSYADVVLLFPRAAVHAGSNAAIPDFKHIGDLLTQAHVSYDVAIDDEFSSEQRQRYGTIFQPLSGMMTDPTSEPLAGTLKQGMVDATTEVVATAWEQPSHHRLLLHLVNYKKELADAKSTEKPVAQENIAIHLKLPQGATATKVTLFSPDEPAGAGEKALEFTQDGGVLKAKVDRVLVYSIVVVDLK